MLDAAAHAVMNPFALRMLDPRLRGDDTEWVDGLATRKLRSTDRSSWPAATPNHAQNHAQWRTFAVRLQSSTVHQNRNPFRPLSEFSPKLSPRSVAEVESRHRRTTSEVANEQLVQ